MGTPMRPVSCPSCPEGHFEVPLTGIMKVQGFDLRSFDKNIVNAMNETLNKAVLVWNSHSGDTVPRGKIELSPTCLEYMHSKLDKPYKIASQFTIHSHMLIKYGFALKYIHGPFYKTRFGHKIPFEIIWLRLPA